MVSVQTVLFPNLQLTSRSRSLKFLFDKLWRSRWLNPWQDPIQCGRLVLTAMKKSGLPPKKASVLFKCWLLEDSAFLAAFAAFTFLSAKMIGKMSCILAPVAITPSENSKNYDEVRREIIRRSFHTYLQINYILFSMKIFTFNKVQHFDSSTFLSFPLNY